MTSLMRALLRARVPDGLHRPFHSAKLTNNAHRGKAPIMASEIARPNIDDLVLVELTNAQKDKEFRSLQYQTEQTLSFLKTLREKVKNVDGFWLYTLTNHVGLGNHLALASDIDALKYLTDIELVQDPKDPRPYELVFHFKENPYFTNTTITKKFSLPEGQSVSTDGTITDEMREFESYELVPSAATIDWKAGKNLCEKHPRKYVSGEEQFDGDAGSFFWFFTAAEDSFELGSLIAFDILPEAVNYFNGEADNCADDGYDSEEEDDEEDDEDEDEIDLEEEETKPPKKKQRTNGA